MRLGSRNKNNLNKGDILMIFILTIVGIIGLITVVIFINQRISAFATATEIQRVAWSGEPEEVLPEERMSNGFHIVSGNGIEANIAMSGDDKVGREIINVTWDDPEKRKIDFPALKEINPDICAWIKIEGTPINYPVLKAPAGEDEDYYLKRSYKKKSDAHGSVYIRTGDNGMLESFDTVLYGHNMKDGTMFADAHKFLDQDYAKTRTILYIYLPDGTVEKARLVACYETDNELLGEKYNDFRMQTDREKYLSSFENRTQDFEYTKRALERSEAKLVTFSTCCKDDDKRLLMQFAVSDVYDT